MNKKDFSINSRDILLVCLIAVFAVAFRVMYFRQFASTDVYPVLSYSDAYYYHNWARDIASGDFIGNRVFMKWPFYAYFLAFLLALSHNNLLFVYLFQNMLGVLNCLLLYAIARYYFNRAVAFMAGALSVCYVFFIFYDNMLIYTTLSLFLNALFFIALMYAQERPLPRTLLMLGLFLGICTLLQPNIFLCAIPAMLWILWQKKLSLRQRLGRFCVFLAFPLMMLALIGVRNYAVSGDRVFFTAHAGMNFYLGNNAKADGLFHCPEYFSTNQEGMFRDARIIACETAGRQLSASEVNAFWFHRSWEFIRTKPAAFFALLKDKVMYLFSGEEFIHDAEYPSVQNISVFKFLLTDLRFILPFALVGMIALLPSFRAYALLYFMVIMYSLSIVLFFITTRYRIIEVPFLIIFASAGVWCFWDSLKRKQFVKVGLLLAGVLLFYFLCNYNGLLQHRRAYNGSTAQEFDSAIRTAVRLTSAGKYDGAMKEAGKAVALKPQGLRSLFALAVAQFHMGKLEEAETNFKHVIALFPYSVDSYYNLGVIYYRQGRFSEAQEALSRAVHLDPDDIDAHFELARTYRELKLFPDASKEYGEALKRLSPWKKEDIALIRKELSALPK